MYETVQVKNISSCVSCHAEKKHGHDHRDYQHQRYDSKNPSCFLIIIHSLPLWMVIDMLPCLMAVITFVLILAARISYLKKREAEDKRAFWEREREADKAPTRDITDLPYINIPIDKFPLDKAENEEELSAVKKIRELTGNGILNLSDYTNTDLKLMYGPKNLDRLKACDENFLTMEKNLLTLSDARIAAGDFINALIYLEFLSSCRSDLSSVYIDSGTCLRELRMPGKIRILMEYVPSLHLTLESKVLKSLEADLAAIGEENIVVSDRSGSEIHR